MHHRADRLVADRDTAFKHEFLDLAEGEREPEVQQHAVVDDLDWVVVAFVRRHCGARPTDVRRASVSEMLRLAELGYRRALHQLTVTATLRVMFADPDHLVLPQ